MNNQQKSIKKEWQKPEVISHGSVQKLTKGSLAVIGSLDPSMVGSALPE